MVLKPACVLILFSAIVLLQWVPSAFARDISPLKDCHVWLPMTGVTPEQMDDARRAGYDTVMLKIHPPLTADGSAVDFSVHESRIHDATERGFKLLLPILGWVGLGHGRFWDTDESGQKIMNRLDPFWLQAMEQLEWYFTEIIKHYSNDPAVVAFAPTWGIYGEAGFTSFSAGRSEHALARFNEWRVSNALSPLNQVPNLENGANTDFNQFIRFRFLTIENAFDAMIKRLKEHAAGRPVGMWQEMYPVVGYLWNMVEVPSADFSLGEASLIYQTSHHPEKSLLETMGFRYRCQSAEEYRNYQLPLLARKRGEGQRFMGCQLSNDYVKNYGWAAERGAEIGFDRWEDEFAPFLKELMDAPLEAPKRDVLLVYPTYAASALTTDPKHSVDTLIIDALLRMYGCQIERYGSPRLDKLSVSEMNRFRLIIVPCASYLMSETYSKLMKTKATVVFTGSFAQAFDAEQVRKGLSRDVGGQIIGYYDRPAGSISIASKHALIQGLDRFFAESAPSLAQQESFRFQGKNAGIQSVLRCGDEPLLSVARKGRTVFVHGYLFAGACFDPEREPPALFGSADASCNENDPWGPYSASQPQNAFTQALFKNLLDYAKVDYRVPSPEPRTLAPYLGDHMETVSISANIVYNNMPEPRSIIVRTPYPPTGYSSRKVRERYETTISVTAFSYVVLEGWKP